MEYGLCELALAALVLGLIVFYKRFHLLSSSNSTTTKPLPPGPRNLPVIGHLFHKDSRFFLFTQSLRRYGPVVSFKLGWLPFVVLNTTEAMREAFKQGGLSGRFKSKLVESITHNSGIIFQDGELAKFHRRLTIRILRDLGMGRSLTEQAILREATDLCEHLRSLAGAAVSPAYVLSTATTNVIGGVVFGDRPGYDPNTEQAKMNRQLGANTHNTSICQQFPLFIMPFSLKVVRVLFHFVENLRVMFDTTDIMHECMRQRIQEHREAFKENEEPSDLLFAYLREQKKAEQNGDADFDDWKIIRVIFELFAAGSDTTATSLGWAVLMLALHDDVRRRAATEIHETFGKEHWISTADKKSLPYIQALLDEVLRFGCIVPSGGVLHRTMEDSEVLGYTIKKDTIVFADHFTMFRDPSVWKYPDTFDPRNFLDESGENYVANENLVPFNLGKRSCLGEALARMELFMFIATLVQRFRFELVLPSGDGAPSLDDILLGSEGVVRAPGPHQIRFIPL